MCAPRQPAAPAAEGAAAEGARSADPLDHGEAAPTAAAARLWREAGHGRGAGALARLARCRAARCLRCGRSRARLRFRRAGGASEGSNEVTAPARPAPRVGGGLVGLPHPDVPGAAALPLPRPPAPAQRLRRPCRCGGPERAVRRARAPQRGRFARANSVARLEGATAEAIITPTLHQCVHLPPALPGRKEPASARAALGRRRTRPAAPASRRLTPPRTGRMSPVPNAASGAGCMPQNSRPSPLLLSSRGCTLRRSLVRKAAAPAAAAATWGAGQATAAGLGRRRAWEGPAACRHAVQVFRRRHRQADGAAEGISGIIPPARLSPRGGRVCGP